MHLRWKWLENWLMHFRHASDDDAVGAIVVTGAGRAFCAGMDLSIEGNVFGLDESQQPTLEDVVMRGKKGKSCAVFVTRGPV